MKDIAYMGEYAFVGKYCDLTRPGLVRMGYQSAIDSFVFCSTRLTLGDYAHISPHVSIVGGEKSHLLVEDFCFIATGSRIICGSEDFTSDGLTGPRIPVEHKKRMKLSTVIFQRFSGVGANVVVMPGVTLAEGSVVAANSVVTRDTVPWGLYMGSPARLVREVPREKTIAAAKALGYNYD